MKKSLLHVAFAALLLVGCAQNEITDISPDAAPPVGFKVFTDAQTRGLITNGGASSVNATEVLAEHRRGQNQLLRLCASQHHDKKRH